MNDYASLAGHLEVRQRRKGEETQIKGNLQSHGTSNGIPLNDELAIKNRKKKLKVTTQAGRKKGRAQAKKDRGPPVG